jgi:hypothetical protein
MTTPRSLPYTKAYAQRKLTAVSDQVDYAIPNRRLTVMKRLMDAAKRCGFRDFLLFGSMKTTTNPLPIAWTLDDRAKP